LLAGNFCEGTIQLIATVNDDLMSCKLHTCGAPLDLLEKWHHKRVVGIAQNAHAARTWRDLADQFEALCCGLSSSGRQAGEIAVWPRKIADKPCRDRIARHYDDGNVASRALCRMGGRGLHCDDDIDTAADQLRR